MNDTTCQQFRHAIYQTFLKSRDVLFELIDALLCEPQAPSLPYLSLSPCFRRHWSSIYEALTDGLIDLGSLHAVLLRFLPSSFGKDHLWIGVDASSIVRPYAHTSPDRSMVYVANPGPKSKPVHFGWQFSTLMVLPLQPSSWTYLLDQQYIPACGSATQTALLQLQALRPRLCHPVTIVADSGYGNQSFLHALIDLDLEGLVRLKTNRVFFREPHRRIMDNKPHPARFQCSDPSTHGEPSRHLQLESSRGAPICIDCWQHLFLKGSPSRTVSVLRIRRPHARGDERDPIESWFAWVGKRDAPLHEVCRRYGCRFSQEHCYRYLKTDLLWDVPQVRTPEQFALWSWLVLLAFNQLVLARECCQPVLLPWERPDRASSPRRVRRGMVSLLCKVGTPARPPQPRGRSPGRAKGFVPKPAPRYRVLVKKRSKPSATRRTTGKKRTQVS